MALTVTIDLADLGTTPVELPELPQPTTDTLLLAHPPWHSSDPGPVAVVWLDRSRLVRLAFAFAVDRPQTGPIVVWPAGVPVTSTALAFAVGGLLTAQHPDAEVARVVCAARPPARRTRPTVQHDVRVEIDGQIDRLII
ncbi:hypothetical protein [Pseudofrankia asymbiotica]|uniref:Uncharacterized protein n=1 Tax=Pseudofrankia asymbiotica TaxID=1834516 RepID=A0A1V2I0H2_9ACTN|nr:hypothetical protein [Pseudofrankia asymbiotica]ONH22650.1 hypothetical protein BL253_35105 [Pseudofrankia asymbiotica]